MSPRSRAAARRRLLPYVLLLVVSLALGGCGVGATARPVDEGDPAGGVAGRSAPPQPPGPDQALTADQQVRNFLQVSVGGRSAAVERLSHYFTPEGLDRWPGPTAAEAPPVTVVRLVSGPTSGASIGRRTPVTVTYETIGTLNESGRIEDLGSATRELIFWVVANPDREFSLRIDEIENWPAGQLLLSDEGLQNQYLMQPIYFWDMEYRLLVPDLRYMPSTLRKDQRAKQVLDWLVGGPSPWVGGVRTLPVGTSEPQVVIEPDDTIVVDLSQAVVGTGEPEVVRKLMYQLQWSFAALEGDDEAPDIELRIGDTVSQVEVGEGDFRNYNHSWSYRESNPLTYDIVDGVVVADGGAAPAVLSSPENTGVQKAAVSLDETKAALVRADSSGLRSLRIVGPRGVVGSEGVVHAQVPMNRSLGRPLFVPGTQVVLVPTGPEDGRLFAVSTRDGSATEVFHTPTDVTAVAVSPDGRRVAFISEGDVFVSSLVVVNDQVTVASTRRQVLANRLHAQAVTWTAESWLLVAGTSGDRQALWRVSADGVLVEDLSGNLGGLGVVDLVSYPRWTGSPRWSTRADAEVLAVMTVDLVYSLRTRPSPETAVDPFFGS